MYRGVENLKKKPENKKMVNHGHYRSNQKPKDKSNKVIIYPM